MPPAARVTDMHVCPMVTVLVPHVGGPILPPGVPTVLIGFLPAATVTNMLTCVGPPDIIVKGSAGVFINFLPAARMGDMTAHGGVIILGEPTVMIGEIGSPSPGAGGMGAIVAGLVAAGLPGSAAGGSKTALLSTPAPPGQAAGGAPAPAWTQDSIKANLDKCDGGSDVWAKAKTAAGKEPVIQEGASVIGTGASEAGNTITIDHGFDQCTATQLSVFELTNVSQNSAMYQIRQGDCQAGLRDKNTYIRDCERLEYNSVKQTYTVFDKCREKWGCPATATSWSGGYKSAKDFDDYFANYLPQRHKDFYANEWDNKCSAAYNAKHSPAPAPGVTPPSPPPPKSSPAVSDDAGNSNDDQDSSDSD